SGKMDYQTAENFRDRLAGFLKGYARQLDAKVTAKVLALYAKKTPEIYLPAGSKKEYSDENKNLHTKENWSKNSEMSGRRTMNGATVYNDINKVFADRNALVQNLKNDPLIKLFASLREAYMKNTNDQYNTYQTQIDELQKTYMGQQMSTDKDKTFFPDANS